MDIQIVIRQNQLDLSWTQLALSLFLSYFPSSVTHNEHAYRQTSEISRTLAGNEIVDHVVGASPVGAAPTASSFST